MAERDDEVMRALAHSISVSYSLLVEVCQALPVPVTMPTDRHIPAVNAVPAVQRVAELAKDQPMGETQVVQLYSGCIHILAAIDLYALCAVRYEDTRAEGVAVNLLRGDSELEPLLIWLLANNAG